MRTTAAWDAFSPMREQRMAWIGLVAAPVTSWLVNALAVRPGETVLELAAGTGDVGFAIIERIGRGVRLVSSDVSPATVDVARRRAAARGLQGIEFRVLDAQELDQPSASVDAVACRWGYMLMDRPASAFRETARVLRPGGRLAFSVWGDAERNPWTTLDAEICRRLGYEPPAARTDPGEMFSLADPRRLRAMVEEGGFTIRLMETVPLSWPYASVEDYIAIEIGQPDPRGDFFRGLPSAQQKQASRIAKELLEPFRTDHGYLLAGETINVLADVSGRRRP